MTELAKVSWEQFVQAMRVFENDLELVHHPHTPKISPFGLTNGMDEEGHRQYNLTQIPESMTEAKFLELLKTRTVVKVGCMDKDASGPSYDQLSTEEQGKIFQILMAGGGAQSNEKPERVKALKTVLAYIAAHGEHLETVLFTGHDNVCGFIKHCNGKTPLTETLGVEPCDTKENIVMQGIILQTSEAIGLEELFPGKVKYVLEVIDRNGKVEPNKFSPNAVEIDLISQQAIDRLAPQFALP